LRPQKQFNINRISRRPITLKKEKAELPDHLIRIDGTPWALWRNAVLRGTGFPAELVLKLSAQSASSAADRLLLAEAEAERAYQTCLGLVREALDALRSEGLWDDAEKRAPLVDALRQLNKGKPPRKLAPGSELAATVDAFRAARQQVEAAQAEFRQSFESSTVEVSEAVRELAGDALFREAVIWQNRNAYHTAIASLQRGDKKSAQNGKRRQHEELIASYLQRYCVKNDTIGFFGPVCWSRLVSEPGTSINAQPGPSLLSSRNVYYESWCIDALVEKLNRNEALRPWVAPRPVPYFHLDGTTLHLPHAPAVQLGTPQAAILKACDGERTARQLAASFVNHPSYGFKSESDVYRQLEELKRRGLIVWALELPTEIGAERRLKAFLESVEDESIRRPALSELERLDERRRAVAAAAGDAEKLDRALDQLEETFSEITGTDATRAGTAGQTYAARTLVYEDCHRGLKAELGPEVLKELEPPLALLLASARWFIYQVMEFYRQAFKDKYEELKSRTGSPVISGPVFWQAAHPLLLEKQKNAALKVVQPLFQQRWAEILKLTEGAKRAEYTVEEIREAVEAAFAVPSEGWQRNCYHSPDVMIAASGPEAIQRGDYHFVMGEMHLGINTLRAALFVAQHPSPEELIRSAELDMPEPRVVPAIPKQWPELTARTSVALIKSKDPLLVVTHDTVGVPKSQALPIGSLVVEEIDGRLMTRSHDGKFRLDLLECLSEMLLVRAANHFKLISSSYHTPRVTIDRLVVSREAWSFSAAQASFAFEKDSAERFIGARRWARERGMPRFIFVKTPVERKPIYVDFDSPIYVDILSKAIRRMSESEMAEELIGASEMLPQHEESWLSDADGRRYASEFRIVALDIAN
jgi:hypothetical protein